MKSCLPRILKIVLTISSVLISLFFIELYLQHTQYQKKPLLVDVTRPFLLRTYPHDSQLIYNQKYFPNNHLPAEIDPKEKLHFRPDFRRNDDVTSETYTILMIGDSFTFGHNVSDPDTYPSKVEELLNTWGYNVNVYNAGVSGYGTDQQYLYIQRILKFTQPNLVVINLHENDIYDSNDNCLFQIKESGTLTQVTGVTSNMFLESVISKYTPTLVRNTDVFNLLLSGINKNNFRVNYSCTKPEVNTQLMLKKMKTLITQLEKELQPNSDLLLVLVPTETYIDLNYPNDLFRVSDRRHMTSELYPLQIIDAGATIAQSLDPSIFRVREGAVPEQERENLASQSSLSLMMFNDHISEPESEKGLRHLSPHGNLLFADLISRHLLSHYSIPRLRTLDQ